MPTTTGKATDLITFSRGSLATVTDSDGKIKWAAHNLLTNSEQFDASAWVKSSATVAANAVAAPNGTTTADTLTASGANGTALQTFTAEAIPYTFGVWLKRKTGTGTIEIAADSGTWVAKTITSDWALYTVTQTPAAGSKTAGIRIVTSADAVEVWGAHLYRSDLGGMQVNASAYPYYNSSTPKNLIGFSEAFTDAWWTKLSVTVAAQAAAGPTGMGSATLAYPTSTGTDRLVYRGTALTGAANTPYTISVYAKASGINFLYFGTLGGGTSPASTLAFFDLASGTKTQTGSYFTSATITPIGNGWYRCSATASVASASLFPVFGLADANNSTTVTASGTNGVLLWGAQLSDSASLDAYSPTFAAVTAAAAFHGPRLDFASDGSARGLLVEEARINLTTNSNAPTMGTGLSSTTGAAVSPDGTMSAVRVTKTDTTTPRYFSRSTLMTTVGGRKYAVSTHFKYDGYDVDVSLEYNSTANWDLSWSAIFAVASTGVTVKSENNTISSVQNVGNGWYRAITTFTAGAAPSSTANPAILTRVTGAPGTSVLVYGAMVEENATFATSYIPTAASTVTRNADVASVGVSQFPYSSSAGTFVANFQTLYSGSHTATTSVVGGDSSGSRLIMYIPSGNQNARSYDGSTVVSATGDVTGPAVKVASGYSTTARSVCIAGGTVATGTVAAGYPAASTINIGGETANGPLNGWFRQMTYIPRLLSDAEMQSRTL